ANALALLGADHALLVHGADGLDEVSLAGLTDVREVRGHAVRSFTWEPDDFGLGIVRVEETRVDGPQDSAALVLSVLRGIDSPALRLVLANAAAGLIVAGKAKTPCDAVALAKTAVREGKAMEVLEHLR